MATEFSYLKDTDTATVMNAVRSSLSLDYQSRVPKATKANISQTINNLADNRPLWNEFISALVNRVGSVYARNMIWSNPLSQFKTGMLTHGNTIEEIQVGLLEAHTYSGDREYGEKALFGTETPEVKSSFHNVNRQEMYKFTIDEPNLRQAMLDGEPMGDVISGFMNAPVNSDNWDEFLQTCSLIREYETDGGGFYHVNIPDLRTLSATEDDARAALKRVRAVSGSMKFLSRKYNSAHMPTFATADELILICTPEFKANIDVEGLAPIFNINKADIGARIIEIPADQFAIDGAQALLTTEKFFVIADQVIENRSQDNAASMRTNYFLHHWEVLSVSRFAPAVLFWTGASDDDSVVVSVITALAVPNATDSDGATVTKVKAGGIYQLSSAATYSGVENDNLEVNWNITSVTVDSKTVLDSNGILTVGSKEKGVITIKATANDGKVESGELSLTVA